MKTSAIYTKAADLIEQHGWFGPGDFHSRCKAVMESPTGSPVCAALAISQAISPEPVADLSRFTEYYLPLKYAIGRSHTRGLKPIFEWNDHSTKDEVIAMLRAVAASERAREAEETVTA